MPTADPERGVDLNAVRATVADAAFGGHRGRRRIGLEAELFPVVLDSDGRPTRRPLVAETARKLEDLQLPDDAPPRRGPGPDPNFELTDGSRITFEPGGQLELAGTCRSTPGQARRALDRSLGLLATGLADHGLALVSCGADPWHDTGAVPMQLRAARYPAMAAYLSERGGAGATMMRNTCALQVNLDLEPGSDGDAQWDALHLVAPLLTASFACSPDGAAGVASTRAGVWTRLDTTRTGFPARLIEQAGDPAKQLTEACLQADVLVFDPGGAARPGRPGFTFRDWMTGGDDRHGWPTVEDVRYHLTTLFHEIRPRRYLEVRGIDAVPARWRGVPAVLLAGLSYDRRARERVREVMEPHRGELSELLSRAARTGLRDGSMCALAVECWSYAIEGAGRLGTVEHDQRRAAEQYLDRFVMRGRTPADEMAELLEHGDAAALAWAREPVGSLIT